MKETLIIAWREYAQYVFSRGFLLLLLLAPLGLAGLALLMSIMQRSIPDRHFLVYDQTGTYTEEIDHYFKQRHNRRVIRAWDQYIALYIPVNGAGESPLPDPFAPAPVTKERADAFEKAGGVKAALEAATPHLPSSATQFEPPKQRFTRVDNTNLIPAGTSLNEAIDIMRPFLLGNRSLPSGIDGSEQTLFAALLIPDDFSAEGQVPAQYWSRNLVDAELKDILERALDRGIQKRVATEFGLDQAAYEKISSSRAVTESFRPDRETEEAALNLADRIESALPAGMTYFLFILIFSVGSLLLTNTIEERSNKIVEMLLSSVTANQLMMGKLLGIGAVGLTIPALGVLFSLAAALTFFAGNPVVQEIIASVFLSPLVWIYLFYFLCGYVIFAMLYLAIGAISNSLQDAQTFLGPVTLVVMAPLPLMVLVFQDPNGLMATIMTWIPIYTPYAVMLRAASDPPLWEIIGATIFMLVFGGVFVTLMGRIFRRGLLSASPPNLKSLIRLAGREKH